MDTGSLTSILESVEGGSAVVQCGTSNFESLLLRDYPLPYRQQTTRKLRNRQEAEVPLELLSLSKTSFLHYRLYY